MAQKCQIVCHNHTAKKQQTKTWIQAHPAPNSVLLNPILCGFLNDKVFFFKLTLLLTLPCPCAMSP